MSKSCWGRIALRVRPLSFVPTGCLLALLVLLSGQVQAMWARMSDAELIEKSQLIVVGEWIGQSPLRLGQEGAAMELAVIAVSEVLRGPQSSSVAFVAVPGSEQPVSSSDLRFKRGDSGVWFLRLRRSGEPNGPYVVDHPQRFLPSLPENAQAINALRGQLRRK